MKLGVYLNEKAELRVRPLYEDVEDTFQYLGTLDCTYQDYVNITGVKCYFKFSKYQCPHCEGIMQSKWSGHLSICECGQCFIDQTEYYIRVGGPAQYYLDGDE